MGYDINLEQITGVEFRGRTTHTSNSGVEVHRRYWCEPFVAWENIVTAIEGNIEKVGADWTRTTPASDAFFDNNLMYATEVRIEHVDTNGIAYSPSLNLNLRDGAFGGAAAAAKALEDSFRDEANKEESWGGLLHYSYLSITDHIFGEERANSRR